MSIEPIGRLPCGSLPASRKYLQNAPAFVLLAVLVQGCLEAQRSRPTRDNQCTACHGDESRSGDRLQKSAPPFDLNGNTEPSARGVGAHQNHLVASPTHEAVPCSECHLVPEEPYASGHFDPGSRIEFGASARSHGQTPIYDSATASCSGTYCHHMYAPQSNPKWQAPRDSLQACGSCHGVPPALPHSQKTDCSECHGQVIDRAGHFRNRALHLDGTVQVTLLCNNCHGSSNDGAPPPGLHGIADSRAPGVGAHQRHLQASETHAAVACGDCHATYDSWDSPGHIDDNRPADVQFSGVATLRHPAASYSPDTGRCSNTYCHGNGAPVWTEQKTPSETCGTCHALPPPFIAGVPISAGGHPKSDRCANCHGNVIGQDRTFIAPERHVDGKTDVAILTCTSCHGSDESSSPPGDLAGGDDERAIGVGAHRTHLTGGNSGSPVACAACHIVPEQTDDPGHIDDWTIAEVTFSGAAVAQNRSPFWDRESARCTNVWCHGADNSVSSSPAWTDTSASLGCSGCHGMPPPAPHVQLIQCHLCHSNVRSDHTFGSRTSHVNGIVDF